MDNPTPTLGEIVPSDLSPDLGYDQINEFGKELRATSNIGDKTSPLSSHHAIGSLNSSRDKAPNSANEVDNTALIDQLLDLGPLYGEEFDMQQQDFTAGFGSSYFLTPNLTGDHFQENIFHSMGQDSSIGNWLNQGSGDHFSENILLLDHPQQPLGIINSAGDQFPEPVFNWEGYEFETLNDNSFI